MEEQELYQKFLGTRQEAVRLDAALQGFFSDPSPTYQTETGSQIQPMDPAKTDRNAEIRQHHEAYGAYLKRRIRPAVEKLILQGEIEKIEDLEKLGWFHAKELDYFIEFAMKTDNYPVLMWLQKLKQEIYGYQDRDFSL